MSDAMANLYIRGLTDAQIERLKDIGYFTLGTLRRPEPANQEKGEAR